ncbi:MAG: LLM class flavin-dependent oxidoreductase [Nocardioides sp.]|uniref:LLM class flavin-dependent oxidoreductase n=1 Tax=Nocardioides sp. TaxID=35761 RepID=UPI0039E613D0
MPPRDLALDRAPDPSPHLHLAVALDGAGWHPAAWREPDARPEALLTPSYWTDLVRQAEGGLLDLVTIEDGLALQSESSSHDDHRIDRVRGRLDAVLIAARVAPATRRIGLVPTAIVTHTEPFHLSKAIATLDYAAAGRAGVQVRISGRADEAAHFGRRTITPFTAADRADLERPDVRARLADAFAEAADYVEVLRRLWDSWEDDAEIRDVTTGRFVDRDKLHYIDFEGRFFSVKGPSITPRPPQGQPIVAALGRTQIPYEFIASCADLGFVTPHSAEEAAGTVTRIRAAQAGTGRSHIPGLFADILVFLEEDAAAARGRLSRLDDLAGREFASDAEIFAGTPTELADLLQAWQAVGLAGFRLRPGTLPYDLTQITEGLVPELQRRGAFRAAYDAGTLRGHLGLARPVNRYAATA